MVAFEKISFSFLEQPGFYKNSLDPQWVKEPSSAQSSEFAFHARLGASAQNFFSHSPKIPPELLLQMGCPAGYKILSIRRVGCAELTQTLSRDKLINGILAYHQAHPQDPSAQRSLQILLTREDEPAQIPWLIDDLKPKTGLDEKIRLKIKQAKRAIDALLATHGVTAKKDAERYEKLVAVLAFYFVAAPPADKKSAQEFTKIHKHAFSDWYQGLVALEQDPEERAFLLAFLPYLKKQGGLGSSLWKDEFDEEKTALGVFEALEEKDFNVSSCSKSNKVLYHVYQQMGLRPNFVLIKGRDHDTAVSQKTGTTFYTKGKPHICLQVNFGPANASRLFDLTHLRTFQSRAEYPHYKMLNLRQYLSVDLMNQANSKFLTLNESIDLLSEAVFFDAENPYAHHSLSLNYHRLAMLEGKNSQARLDYLQKAKEAAKKSMDLDPSYAPAYSRLAITFEAFINESQAPGNKEDPLRLKEQVTELHRNALRLDPDLEIAKDRLARLQSNGD